MVYLVGEDKKGVAGVDFVYLFFHIGHGFSFDHSHQLQVIVKVRGVRQALAVDAVNFMFGVFKEKIHIMPP